MRQFAIARGIDVWRRTVKTKVLMMVVLLAGLAALAEELRRLVPVN